MTEKFQKFTFQLSARVAGSSTTESNTMLYILDQLYALKSNVQQLENEMKLVLTLNERRIQVIENRKYLYKAIIWIAFGNSI